MVARALRPVEEGGWGGGLAAIKQLAAGLINATAADVAHPFDDIMVAVVQLRFKHLQVAHLEARGCEWHLGKGELRLVMCPSCQPLSSAALPYLHLSYRQVTDWGLKEANGVVKGPLRSY